MLTQIVGSLLLPKEEKAVLESLKKFATATLGVGVENGFEDIVGQLKGEIPMADMTMKTLDFINKGSQSPLWQTAVSVGVNSLAEKGLQPNAVAGLLDRFARMLGVTTHQADDPVERIAVTLGNVASGCKPEYAPVVGALVVCPECGFTHLI